MQIVKVSTGNSKLTELFLRQSPGGLGVWGGCKFYVNQYVVECDWWIVCHISGIIDKEKTLCDPKNIIYISMEPNESLLKVNSKFLSQFNKLVLVDRSINHHNILYRNIHTWWAGMRVKHRNGIHSFEQDSFYSYDQFKSMLPQSKVARISVIVSSKDTLLGHRSRLKFLDDLMNQPINKYIDLYGGGFNPIDDKLDVISPYKYHLVLENSIVQDYWSEKLADAYLGYAFPLYVGCPNVSDYFSGDSLMILSIDDDPKDISLKLIEMILSDKYENSLRGIETARNDILNKYNIFAEMARLCAGFEIGHNTKHLVELKPNYFFSNPYYLRIIKRLVYSMPSLHRLIIQVLQKLRKIK
jgi:hypothetical protein